MGRIVCFWLEPTDRERVALRRYARPEYNTDTNTPEYGRTGSIFLPGEEDRVRCPLPWGYHNAAVKIGEEARSGERSIIGDLHPHDDPRWPTECPCGYRFRESDEWQRFLQTVWRRADSGELLTLDEAGPGAMYDADWMSRKGPDGRSLVVKTPAGEWMIDGPSRNGPGWTRTGEPPLVTARPSIGIGEDGKPWTYHAYLTAGVLEDC